MFKNYTDIHSVYLSGHWQISTPNAIEFVPGSVATTPWSNVAPVSSATVAPLRSVARMSMRLKKFKKIISLFSTRISQIVVYHLPTYSTFCKAIINNSRVTGKRVPFSTQNFSWNLTSYRPLLLIFKGKCSTIMRSWDWICTSGLDSSELGVSPLLDVLNLKKPL